LCQIFSLYSGWKKHLIGVKTSGMVQK